MSTKNDLHLWAWKREPVPVVKTVGGGDKDVASNLEKKFKERKILLIYKPVLQHIDCIEVWSPPQWAKVPAMDGSQPENELQNKFVFLESPVHLFPQLS